MNKKAEQILQKTDADKLPSLPHVLLRLLDICHDETLSYSNLANILKQDPALYARVYSICHQHHCSTLPAQDYSSQTIENTLQHLGINTLKSIAVTAAVQQFFSRTSLERTDFLKQHWQHSLYSATVAQSIARLCNYADIEEAYTTGLLHNVGQLVLETAFPEKYTRTFAELSDDEIFHNLELDEFDTTHQQVGAELLKKHGANSFVYDAILYHHENVEHILDAHPLVKIINLTNMLTSGYFQTEDQQVFDAAETLLGLDKPLILEMLEKSQEQRNSIAQSLEIAIAFDGMDGETAKQQNAGDEFKQVQLAEQVRNIALLDGIHQHLSRSGDLSDNLHRLNGNSGKHTGNSPSENNLLTIISQHIGILFGVSQCILFLYDAANDRINAISANNQPPQLADLSIPLIADRSLVTDALLNKQASHSFDDKISRLSIIDRQLIGFAEHEGIICLPMMMNNAAIGTLILGVNRSQYESLWKQLPLLTLFVNEVAHTISVNHSANSTKPNADDATDSLQQKIREVLHEVRNPLSIMNNYLGILSYKLESDKPAQEDVKTIKSEIERIGHILNRLTETENITDKTSPIDINAIIADLTHVFQTSLFASKNIQITLDLDERIESLQSNANALKQIYTNLIKNAVEALPANGQIMVYTQDYVNVDGKQHIELSVADDGPGIDIDILSQLFSPVNSTKGDDHAGLGLTIVKNLVSELHGSISCRSSDKGTSFHILLPK